jgi:hypothetical protein
MGMDLTHAEEASWRDLQTALADAERAADAMRDAVDETDLKVARLLLLDALEKVDAAQDAWGLSLEARLARLGHF